MLDDEGGVEIDALADRFRASTTGCTDSSRRRRSRS